MAAEESTFPGHETGSVISDTLSDAELIASTRAGDANAFAVLYSRHVDAAMACARRLVRSRSEADDLVAEGFAKVLSALRRGKGPDLAFRPYLLTAVRNALYDRTRRDSRVAFTDEPPEPVNAVLLAADYEREDRAMVAQAYAALPERWQFVLWHTDVEGRQPAEIAPLLGISANSVAALAYRAREGLRQAYLNAHVNRGVNEACRGTTDKLSAYVRDGLSARDRRAVQEHLDGCASCTALLGELQEANRNLKVVLIPVLAGVSASAYLSGLAGGGVTRFVRRNPTHTAAAAVAAAAVVVFAAVALHNPGGDDVAQALTVPPVGSGRPTTTTTTTTLPPTTAPRTTVTVPTTAPYVVPTFDTAVPPITNVPYNPNATTVTTVRRTTTTTRPRVTTTTRPTTTTSTTTTVAQPGEVATTTTTTTTTTLPPTTQAPVPPALQSTVTGLGPVYSGQNAYFSVKVANAASGNGGSARKVAVGPADGVVVSFNLPAGASFTGASSPDWQCEVNGASVRCLLPRIDPGGQTEAVFSLDVPAGATAGTNFTISPTVMVNGTRIDAKPAARQVADGSAIADHLVAPGAQLAVAGNSVLTCNLPELANCEPAENGTAAKVPIKALGGGFTNSSSATLDLADRPVIGAYLVWQGQGTEPGQVTLVAPGGASTVVAPGLTRTQSPSYVAAADVTAVVRAAGTGTYSVANIPTVADVNAYAGWSLVVVTDDGSGVPRAVTVALPMASVISSPNTPVPVFAVNGLTPAAAARPVSFVPVIGEGDRGGDKVGGESVTLNGAPVAGLLPAEPGNTFRSAAVGTPANANTFGLDVDRFGGSAAAASTDVVVGATSGADGVTFSAVAVVYDL